MDNSLNPRQIVEYTRINRDIRPPEQPAEVEPGTSTEIPIKPISERKRQANRKNAQHSTGPKTKNGKSHSRYNALKHGFFIKEMPLDRCLAPEDVNEAKQLVQEFFDHYQPVGPLERMYVEMIVQCCWKMRRLERTENASIKVEIQREWEYFVISEPLRKSSYHLFDKAMKEVKMVGYIDDALVKTILEVKFMGEQIKTDLLLANKRARQLAAQQSESPTPAGGQARKKAQSSLRASLQIFSDQHRMMEEVSEKMEYERRRPHYEKHLPRSLDNLLRYQGAVDRRFYRSIAELERLQRQRLGESDHEPLKLTT
jgi:hypothetical protein